MLIIYLISWKCFILRKIKKIIEKELGNSKLQEKRKSEQKKQTMLFSSSRAVNGVKSRRWRFVCVGSFYSQLPRNKSEKPFSFFFNKKISDKRRDLNISRPDTQPRLFTAMAPTRKIVISTNGMSEYEMMRMKNLEENRRILESIRNEQVPHALTSFFELQKLSPIFFFCLAGTAVCSAGGPSTQEEG